MIFSNIAKIFKNRTIALIWCILTGIALYLWYRYSAIDYVAANYQSYLYAYTDTMLSWGAILLFPLMISGIIYRSLYFGIRQSSHKKSGIFGVFSGIISLFITGASCCGVTLISVFGLTSLIGFLEMFPYHGLEIKFVALIILLYATYDLLRHLEECKVPQKIHLAHKKKKS